MLYLFTIDSTSASPQFKTSRVKYFNFLPHWLWKMSFTMHEPVFNQKHIRQRKFTLPRDQINKHTGGARTRLMRRTLCCRSLAYIVWIFACRLSACLRRESVVGHSFAATTVAPPFRRLPTFGEPQHFAPRESLWARAARSNDNYHARHLPLLPLGKLRHQRLAAAGKFGAGCLISRVFAPTW